jgi:hypothetical protein
VEGRLDLNVEVPRSRHPKPELEAALEYAESHGCEVVMTEYGFTLIAALYGGVLG